MPLILVRHARTAHNTEGRLQGRLDTPLSPDGVAQAERVADALVARYRPDAVFASPLQRARDTAAAVARVAQVPLRVEEELTQRAYGPWQGLTWDEVRERWPREYEVRQAGGDPAVPGWEASADLGARVAPAMRAAALAGERVVVVSHGGALMYGLLALLGLGTQRVLGNLPHGAWNEVTQAADGAWRLTGYGLGREVG